MYLRKTTTAPNRGMDILYPMYQLLPETHLHQRSLDVLQVGAGVASKLFADQINGSKAVRRMDSIVRSLPLPERFFKSFEPIELYETLTDLGFSPRLRVGDINANVLSIIRNQVLDQQVVFELIDVSNIPQSFLSESFDVCIALNVLYHVKKAKDKEKAVNNLVDLTRHGGYIAGLSVSDAELFTGSDDSFIKQIDDCLYQKLPTQISKLDKH